MTKNKTNFSKKWLFFRKKRDPHREGLEGIGGRSAFSPAGEPWAPWFFGTNVSLEQRNQE
jgi:hypothetical protein